MTFLKALLTFEAGGEVVSSLDFALCFFPGCLKGISVTTGDEEPAFEGTASPAAVAESRIPPS